MKWILLLLVAGAAAHGDQARPVWESGPIAPGAQFSHVFEATEAYHDGFSDAVGRVEVTPGGPTAASVEIVRDEDVRFEPNTVEVAAGATVTWTNADDRSHSVVADTMATFNDGHTEDAPAGFVALGALLLALIVRR